MSLTGLPAARASKAQITEAYASPERGELWLINAFIPEFVQANRFNHVEKRPRKLLVNKKELVKLSEGVERAGNTIVPLKLYFNEHGKAKLLIGLDIAGYVRDEADGIQSIFEVERA